MKKPAILFIDGSNFYHALKEQGDLPFGPDKFKELFDKIGEHYNLKQVFFYDAIKNSARDPVGYSKQQRFLESLEKQHNSLEIRTRKLVYHKNITRTDIKKAAEKAGITSDECMEKLEKFLENLGLLTLTKEKGIDVQLIADAIETARKGKDTTILLLTGDADFVPAVKLIKTYGNEVVNLHPYKGSSTELRKTCDKHMLITFNNEGIILKTYDKN